MNQIDRGKLRVPGFFYSRDLHTSRRNLLTLFQASREKLEQSLVPRGIDPHGSDFVEEVRAAFSGRCAFCERSDPGAPMRFRPESEAEPVDNRSISHLYYSWLSTSWDNWYWICSACRPENERHFPLSGSRAKLPQFEEILRFCDPSPAGTELYPRATGYVAELPVSWSHLQGQDSRSDERPLLLDPCRDRIWKHLTAGPDGELVGYHTRGQATINHYRLDRKELHRTRASAVRQLNESLLAAGALRASFFEDDLEHPGFLKLRLRAMASFLAGELGAGRVSQWRDVERIFARAAADPRAPTLLEAATRYDPRTRIGEIAGVVAIAIGKTVLPQVDAPATPMPRPVRVQLENFKSLEHIEFTIPPNDLRSQGSEGSAGAGALLILGENATGKSSILEGAVLCLSDSDVRKAIAPDPGRLVLDPRYMDPNLVLPAKQSRLRVIFSDKSAVRMSIRDGKIYPRRTAHSYPVFAYGAFRQYLRGSPSALAVDHQVATLFHGDRLLPNPTAWLLSLTEDRFKMVARSLSVIFAIEGDFEMIRREHDICYVVNDYMHGGVARTEQTPLDSVSSGFRAILAMTCDIMRGLMEGPHGADFQSLVAARAIVFIDEIEAHLHPRWKLSIMSSLRQALPNVTFIVTSHDPLCLRGMATGEVMVLNRVRGIESADTKLPIYIEALDTLPNIEELTIEQLLTADFFQLNSTASLETDREYARIADLLKEQAEALGGDGRAAIDDKNSALRSFTREINEALPVGDSEVQRLVQSAVAEYLRDRSKATAKGLAKLRADTRKRILDALRTI